MERNFILTESRLNELGNEAAKIESGLDCLALLLECKGLNSDKELSELCLSLSSLIRSVQSDAQGLFDNMDPHGEFITACHLREVSNG
ncbi:hypothetical protein [Desulfovibrio oxyclinae]|uniref:hypothetical protein n=1 Tax=Desulfovibrio oxyclinae TaxID=63560 RepID=UPI00037A2AA8|nr:hypothetical protein [Desulfovibrio oxyclinae]